MARTHWFLITLVFLFKVYIEGTPTVSVVCNNNLTVTITIMDVTDLAEYNVGDWRIDNKQECEPTFSGQNVIYTNLPVSTCASKSKERTDKSDILFLFKIRAVVPGNGPTQAMDYAFDASCAYASIYSLTVSYELITNHGGNNSDPTLIVSFRNMTVEKGQTVALFCNVSGTPTPNVSWTHVNSGKKRFSDTWVITDIKVDDIGQYRCDAINKYGNDSKSIFVYFENAIAKIVIVSLKISNKVWIQEFEDLTNSETQSFAGEIKDSVSDELNGTGIINVKVTKLRKGSVIANIELTFKEAVGESELHSLLSEAIKDGTLGQLQVHEIVVGPTIFVATTILDDSTPVPSEPAKVNKDVIYGTVIGVLALMLIIFLIYLTLKLRKRRGDTRPDVMAEGTEGTRGAQLNEGMETERNNENTITTGHHGAGQYMELAEVSQNQGSTGTETSPYSEINEYAPLHPGTRSWEVPRANVVMEKVIGKGAFGQVAQGKASHLRGAEDTMTVAIKMLQDNATETERKDLLSELEVMKKLKPHPHVIKLLGCVTETDPLLVIIEYVPYGDLLGYLRKSRGLNDTYFKYPDVKPQTSLTSQQLIKFSWQVADGMRYLSSRKIIHRDLAARNVLVGERETCKVTDFGMARDVYQENVYEKKTKGRLPVKWTAYEALLFGRYTTKSDVWSFGVVVYEIFTIGGSPYPQTDGRKMADLLNRGYRMPKPRHVDKALYKIMQDCWQENPDDRPTFEYLRDELKEMENQHQRHINLREYDKKLYENVEDLMF
ncbi:fibroblast growth factor receptor 1-like isoform X2 [Oculina patagonica]